MQAKPNIVDVVLAGGVITLALALAALPVVGRSFDEMYREFGGEMPLLTRLATSYWFPLTLSGTTVVALAPTWALAKGRALRGVLLSLVGTLLVVNLLSWYGLYEPVFRLAGKIQ